MYLPPHKLPSNRNVETTKSHYSHFNSLEVYCKSIICYVERQRMYENGKDINRSLVFEN